MIVNSVISNDQSEESLVSPDLGNSQSMLSRRPYFSEGGWKTYPSDMVAQPGPCNIDIKDTSFSLKQFLKEYSTSRPFIVRDSSNNDLFRALARKAELISSYGHTTVTLSSANSYSYEKVKMSFSEYCDKHTGPQSINTLGNETFYMFGDNDYEEWSDFLQEYSPPPYNLPGHTAAFSFGVAGAGSGVPFHTHGPGFAETIYGRKRWFLTPPDVQPEFHPNRTTLQWLLEDYERVKNEISLYECTIRPGEAIYFPHGWWHATLNIDTSVFISTFLSP